MSNRKYMLIGWYSRNVTQMMSLTTRFQILILLLNFKRFSDFHDNVSHSHIVVLYTNAEVYVLDLGSREPMNARVALRVIMHLISEISKALGMGIQNPSNRRIIRSRTLFTLPMEGSRMINRIKKYLKEYCGQSVIFDSL